MKECSASQMLHRVSTRSAWVCAFFLGLEDRMTLDLVEARLRPGASSPDPSIVIADILRGIGQGQLAASGMLARMGAIVRRHLSQPPRPSAAVTAVRTWRRRPGRAVLAGALIAILAVQVPIAALAQTVVVGGKNYTEQLLMAEMTSQLLTSKGLRVETRSGFDTTSLRKAQETGVVDLYWEYTGTSLSEFIKATEKLSPTETAFTPALALHNDRVYEVLRDLKLIDVGMVFA